MRRSVGFGIAIAIFIVLAACVGDDPGDGSSGALPDGGDSKPIGTRCSPGESCSSGSCVDGYCCDKPCAGQCEACDVEGKLGQCSPVTGKPHHTACDGQATGACAGSCDGTNVAACTYPQTECIAGSCAAGTAKVPSKCAAGTCPAQTSQACALGCFEEGCLGVKQVAAGYYHTCALLTDKKVRCWGDNTSGKVGVPVANATVQKTPLEVANLSNIEAIASSQNSTCVLLADKTVRCWGSNVTGELGRGALGGADEKALAVVGLTGASALFGSTGGHYCAIVADGELRCWGGNLDGQLGDGSLSAGSGTPVKVCAAGTMVAAGCTSMKGVKFVASGDGYTCAIQADGQVACWGQNSAKELGFESPGTTFPKREPLARLVPTVTGATYLTGGNRLTCAASGGGAKCWSGEDGKLGNGTDDSAVAPPVAVCTKQDCSTLLTNVTALSTADVSVCAISGGAVKCWGSNNAGQLGDGTATSAQNYAASTAIASGAVAITSGGAANFAIVVDGANRDLRCWGANQSFQCGNETVTTAAKIPIAPKW